jgi:hypothetical protein
MNSPLGALVKEKKASITPGTKQRKTLKRQVLRS